ncbi:hypothetical protein LguiB_029757 [Lonicera macranthoides]
MEKDKGHQTMEEMIIIKSITDLPYPIIADILSRLPTKSIIACRCVCKNWLNLTSFDPTFAHLHFSTSPLDLLLRIQTTTPGRLSSTLHLLDPELDCRSSEKQIDIKPRFNLRKLESGDDLSVAIVNSCNGLLCLSDAIGNNPSFVCNPITGEYIIIPKPNEDVRMESVKYSGLGFCPNTKQYKVLRMFYELDGDLPNLTLHRMAEIHVLGSDLWRGIGRAPLSPHRGSYAAFLNGALHWDCDDHYSLDFIVSFDFVSERFGKIPPPPHFGEKHKERKAEISLGVLGEHLYLCDATSALQIDVWLMKEYGVQESWSKDYVIDKFCIDPIIFHEGTYRPIKLLKNGEMLMVYPDYYLVCFDPLKKSCRYFKFREVQSQLEVILHTPSFASLKDVVSGVNAKVLKLRPRKWENSQTVEKRSLLYHLRLSMLLSEEVVVGEEIETETLFLVPEEDPQTEEMAWIINYWKSHYRSN